MPMKKQIDICIITHNRKENLIVTLDKIIDQVSDIANILVLDNGSDDGTEDALRDADILDRIRYLKSSVNRGVSRGRNILWRLSSSEYLLSMDDDILISRASICEMIALCRQENSAAIISPIIVNAETGQIQNPVKVKASRNSLLYEGCFLLPRTVLNRIGYLDRRLMYAAEGWDYAHRMRQAGYQIKRAPEVRVFHFERDRPKTQDAKRRLAWVWSFAYAYTKNLPALKAVFFTAMNSAAHLKSGVPLFGLRFAVAIPGRALSGVRAGRAEKVRRSAQCRCGATIKVRYQRQSG